MDSWKLSLKKLVGVLLGSQLYFFVARPGESSLRDDSRRGVPLGLPSVAKGDGFSGVGWLQGLG